MLCNREQIGRISSFASRYKASGPPLVFFRGQMLELIRRPPSIAKISRMTERHTPIQIFGSGLSDGANRKQCWAAAHIAIPCRVPVTLRRSGFARWALCAKESKRPTWRRI